jgi:hemerythrin-like metal-binding protein
MVIRLADTMRTHFAEEEDLLRRRRYPGLSDHAAAHEAFWTGFNRFTQAGPDGLVAAGPFFEFISDWFDQHMRKQDAPSARFLQAQKAA